MEGGDFDLNSQASASEEFPDLGLYGAYLQGDEEELLPGHGSTSGLRPYRPPRAGAGDGRATQARQMLFGGPSSAAAGRGRGRSPSRAGGSVRRGNSASAAPARRNQRSSTVPRGSSVVGQRLPHSRAPMAPRSVGRGQSSGFNAPFHSADEEMDEDVEELASSGGLPVSQTNRAQWNDAKHACLLELCLEQRGAGTYNGTVMSGEGYEAVIDGLLARMGLVFTRLQVKNQIIILKSTYSFWRYLQTHTGLGRRPDGTIDADSDFWKTNTEKKPYLKKLLLGPPANEELLDQLFRGCTVDGSTAFVPGDDYGENPGQEEEEEDEEEFHTPPSASAGIQRSQKGKRSLSTSSTLTSPVKKSKSPMLKVVKDIATTFKESVTVNTKQMQQRASEKAAFSVQRCQELAFECGVERTVDAVYAMSKMFATQYQREFFCGQLTPDLRLGYFKKWCRDNNLE